MNVFSLMNISQCCGEMLILLCLDHGHTLVLKTAY